MNGMAHGMEKRIAGLCVEELKGMRGGLAEESETDDHG